MRTIAIGSASVYTARVTESNHWRPARLAATGEWCVCAPHATFLLRLSEGVYADEQALTSEAAQRRACILADALNRIYNIVGAPHFTIDRDDRSERDESTQ
jgi:hypothetical protein